MSTSKPLKAKIRSLKQRPGVYQFLDRGRNVLYIGKANNLKNRVGSYLTDKHSDRPWIKVMMGLVDDVEVIVVENELEALLLESSLIKEYEPKFNIKLLDDKSYPFIRLSTDEEFPRFSVVRKKRDNDRAKYFGPYLSARYARLTLELLRNLYGIHISSKKLKPQSRPCFYCQLSKHSCVLADEVSSDMYKERTDSAVSFLSGKRMNLVADLRKKMGEASSNQNYEIAAKLRDRLEAVEKTTTKQQVVSTDFDDYDAIGLYKTTSSAAVIIQAVREGRLIGQRDYYFSFDTPKEDHEIIEQFIVSYYRTSHSIPKLVALPTALDDFNTVADILSESASHRVDIYMPERGDKKRTVALANKNAQAKLELKLLKTGSAMANIIAVQELLKLDFLPERIESIDISNLGDSEAVGASVSFLNGEPNKDNYRRYKIKSVKGQNDFAMIREVVSRRLHDTSRPAPDLLLIDGGKQQLRFALEGMEGAPMQPRAIISLAKKPDRIFTPNKNTPIPAPKMSRGLRFLARTRDEVHRFGINFQRQRQRKKSLNT